MVSRHLKWSVDGLFTVVLAGLFLAMTVAKAQDKGKPDLGRIPEKAMDALKAKFPNPGIHKWTKEKEGNIVLYDIEFKQGGRKFEADIKEDGTVRNWEKEIPVRDLPDAVRKAVDAKYRKATLKEVMAITAVKEDKDAPEGYEIVLETADKKGVEVMVAPDGKVLEDSGQKK